MEKRIPAGLSDLYAEMARRNEEYKVRDEKDRERGRLAAALYNKAKNILEEYGEEIKLPNRRIAIRTPSVTAVNGDTRLEFTIEGYKFSPEYITDRHEPIYILEKKETERHFNNNPFFLLYAGDSKDEHGRLHTHLENDAGPEMITAVSSLLDIIQKSLSETQTPRSQQEVKLPKQKKGLAALFIRREPMAQ